MSKTQPQPALDDAAKDAILLALSKRFMNERYDAVVQVLFADRQARDTQAARDRALARHKDGEEFKTRLELAVLDARIVILETVISDVSAGRLMPSSPKWLVGASESLSNLKQQRSGINAKQEPKV